MSLHIYVHNAVILDPTSRDPYATATLSSDPRGINGIDGNTWKMYQSWNDPLKDWALILNLDADEYGFKDRTISTIQITVDGECDSAQCDAYFSFSNGDQEYLNFVTDFDGYYSIGGRIANIFSYPTCGGNVASGSPTDIISDMNGFSQQLLRRSMAGGDKNNWNLLSADPNGDTFPITFTLVNDPINDELTFTFSSATFPSGLTCKYNAVATCQDIKMYFTPDGGRETIEIKTIQVTGDDTGCRM